MTPIQPRKKHPHQRRMALDIMTEVLLDTLTETEYSVTKKKRSPRCGRALYHYSVYAFLKRRYVILNLS